MGSYMEVGAPLAVTISTVVLLVVTILIVVAHLCEVL